MWTCFIVYFSRFLNIVVNKTTFYIHSTISSKSVLKYCLSRCQERMNKLVLYFNLFAFITIYNEILLNLQKNFILALIITFKSKMSRMVCVRGLVAALGPHCILISTQSPKMKSASFSLLVLYK